MSTSLLRAGFGGTSTLHDLKASCDLCGEEANSEVSEVVALDCTYNQCPPEAAMYHQSCLEKYLKGLKCEKNRKIGFPCPRGAGKGTKFSRCVGKIVKSHNISVRSEGNKKKRQAELEQLQRGASLDKDHQKGKGAKKDDHNSKSDEKKTKVAPKATTKPITIRALNIANTSMTKAAPPKSAAQLEREKLAEAAQNLKKEIASKQGGGARLSLLSTTTPLSAAHSSSLAQQHKKEKHIMTLDEYLAERGNSTSLSTSSQQSTRAAAETTTNPAPPPVATAAAPSANAWNTTRSRTTSASSSALDLQTPTPSSSSVSQHDYFEGRSVPPTPPASRQTSGSATPVPVSIPPPPPPQGAWAGHRTHALADIRLVSSSTGVPAPPPPVQSPLSSSSIPGLIPGMEANHGPLTRAQKKNMKRAEKKAIARGHDETSSVDNLSVCDTLPESETSFTESGMLGLSMEYLPPVMEATDDRPGGGVLGSGSSPPDEGAVSRCLRLIVQRKLQLSVDQLQSMGFPASAAVAAVQEHGTDLQAAVASLLQQDVATTNTAGAVQSPRRSTTTFTQVEHVDISEELAVIRDLQSTYNLPEGAIECIVEETQGDVAAAAAVLAERYGAAVPRPAPPPVSVAADGNGFSTYRKQQQVQTPMSPASHAVSQVLSSLDDGPSVVGSWSLESSSELSAGSYSLFGAGGGVLPLSADLRGGHVGGLAAAAGTNTATDFGASLSVNTTTTTATTNTSNLLGGSNNLWINSTTTTNTTPPLAASPGTLNNTTTITEQQWGAFNNNQQQAQHVGYHHSMMASPGGVYGSSPPSPPQAVTDFSTLAMLGFTESSNLMTPPQSPYRPSTSSPLQQLGQQSQFGGGGGGSGAPGGLLPSAQPYSPQQQQQQQQQSSSLHQQKQLLMAQFGLQQQQQSQQYGSMNNSGFSPSSPLQALTHPHLNNNNNHSSFSSSGRPSHDSGSVPSPLSPALMMAQHQQGGSQQPLHWTGEFTTQGSVDSMRHLWAGQPAAASPMYSGGGGFGSTMNGGNEAGNMSGRYGLMSGVQQSNGGVQQQQQGSMMGYGGNDPSKELTDLMAALSMPCR